MDFKDKLAESGIQVSESNIIDITGFSYTSPEEIYNYLYENYWKDCTKRLIISGSAGQENDEVYANRDLAAAAGAAVVYCDVGTVSGKTQYEKFLKDMADIDCTSTVMGWFTEERAGITAASKYGIGTIAANYYRSYSVFSGMDQKINIPKVPLRPALKNKAYIAVYFSDGDNMQYCQNNMKDYWDNEKSDRGKIAINWTFAPGLADAGPGIMNYYYGQASDKECFVTGPSGMGYMMPFNSQDNAQKQAPAGNYLSDKNYADAYTKLTETYLQKTGLRVITLWDGANDTVRDSYEQNCKSLYGVTIQNWSGMAAKELETSTVNGRLSFDLLKVPYYSPNPNYNDLYNKMYSDLKAWTGQSPVFLSYQVSRWGNGLTAEIIAIRNKLAAALPGVDFEFVRADHYFSYYNENNKNVFDLCMLSDTKAASSDNTNIDNVRDSTPVTVWSTSKEGEKYLQFDFGKEYEISRYVIKHAEATGLDKSENIRKWKVEVSENGTDWVLADTYENNSGAVTDMDINPVKARYVKFTVLEAGASGAATMADVEIYGRTI